MLAGRAGDRLADALAAPVGLSMLLRLIRTVPETALPAPKVLGVDEFALRKGHVYATVLVDIETRHVIDLLPDRSVETVSAWLAAHPGVEVICRDRAGTYSEAGRLGAPDAIHVADRYHLWHNLAEAVEKTVLQHRALLPEPAPIVDDEPPTTVVLPDHLTAPHNRAPGRPDPRAPRRRPCPPRRRVALRTIADQLGLARNTVRRLARAADPDELLVGRWTGRASILDPLQTAHRPAFGSRPHQRPPPVRGDPAARLPGQGADRPQVRPPAP
ncbi:transposase [Streptomyces virginiae]|uniref:transposase n=1 Tax=Streptomyces virginiae TaxID=1961 RepID=UPI000A79FE3E